MSRAAIFFRRAEDKYANKYAGPSILSNGNAELLTVEISKEILECQKIYQL